jgi:hypothetical protein
MDRVRYKRQMAKWIERRGGPPKPAKTAES